MNKVLLLAVALIAFSLVFQAYPEADALKSAGTPTKKFGSATDVCGDRLCSEVEEEESTNTFSFGGTLGEDDVPPLIIVPTDFEVPVDLEYGDASVEFSVKAIDNVDEVIDASCTASEDGESNYPVISGAVFLVGDTLVTCTATDSSGNFAENSFTVTVVPDDGIPDGVDNISTLPDGMPSTIQGVLTEISTGNLLNGLEPITLSLYDDEFSSTPIWTETHEVNVVDGFFTLQNIGTFSPVDQILFDENSRLYIGVTFGSNAQSPPLLFVKPGLDDNSLAQSSQLLSFLRDSSFVEISANLQLDDPPGGFNGEIFMTPSILDSAGSVVFTGVESSAIITNDNYDISLDAIPLSVSDSDVQRFLRINYDILDSTGIPSIIGGVYDPLALTLINNDHCLEIISILPEGVTPLTPSSTLAFGCPGISSELDADDSTTSVDSTREFLLSSNAISFGNQVIASSVSQTLTVTNTGADSFLIDLDWEYGGDLPEFDVVVNDSCFYTASKISLNSYESCDLTFTFEPFFTGTWSANLFLSSEVSGFESVVNLNGDGMTYSELSQLTTDDTDGDGILNADETSEYDTDFLNPDSDDDGLTDGEEVFQHDTNPTSSDTDDDGLPDIDELANGTDPLNPDSDEDGLLDSEEVNIIFMNDEKQYVFQSDPLNPDTDDDGLNDYDEQMVHNTSTDNPDTDGDGISDGDEISNGTDPNMHESTRTYALGGTWAAQTVTGDTIIYNCLGLEGIVSGIDILDSNPSLIVSPIVSGSITTQIPVDTIIPMTMLLYSDSEPVILELDDDVFSLSLNGMFIDENTFEGEFTADISFCDVETYDVILTKTSSDVTLVEILDSDGDGISDDEESIIYETDPFNPDSDDDGFSDLDEIIENTDPLDSDSVPAQVDEPTPQPSSDQPPSPPSPDDTTEVVLPLWVTDVAGFWCSSEIEDTGFTEAIQYLIDNNVITVPPTTLGESIDEPIPDWIKNNACWWANGQLVTDEDGQPVIDGNGDEVREYITDDDFASGIQYMIEQGIIVI